LGNRVGFTNKITLFLKENKFVLCPLTPQQVREDELKLKEEIDQEKTEKKKYKRRWVQDRVFQIPLHTLTSHEKPYVLSTLVTQSVSVPK